MAESERDDMYIDEPLNQYAKIFKKKHNENAVAFLDQLIEQSKVDVEQNKETVKKIKKFEFDKNLLLKHIKKKKNLKVFVIIVSIILSVVALYSGTQLYQLGTDLVFILLIVLAFILIGVFIFLIKTKISPKIKALLASKSVVEEKLKALYEEAWKQMDALNDLFYENMAKELLQRTVPLIKLDKMFDSKRLDYMVNKFGLSGIDNIDRSTLFVQSGEIKGNPFYICDDLIHRLGTETYSGSITIHWTTTMIVKGKRVTHHHSQVLTATVSKPCPRYSEEPYLVYANDAAPDLIFSRQDSEAEHMNQKQIDKMVNKNIKKLSKESEEYC